MTRERIRALESAASLPAAFLATARSHPARPAQWRRTPEGYAPITYEHMRERVCHVASGLLRAGVKPGDRVAILMENRPEWAVADYAILAIGGVTVPLYCSYRKQDIAWVLNDSGAKFAITSGGKVARRLLDAAAGLPRLKAVYAIEEMADGDKLRLFAELEAGEVRVDELHARLAEVTPETLATLVYTSGTTGDPKGVMLTHGNIMANLAAIPEIYAFSADDVMLSFLPLAHALERMASHFLPYSFGISVAFAERPDTVARNMAEARPTILIAVPRLLEVVRSRILGQVAKQSPLKQALFRRFLALGMRRGTLRGLDAAVFRLLDRLVGQKIRDRFGGRLRLLVSGGAALPPEVARFFEAIGLPVLEGYGMTEAAPLISVNPVHDRRIGSVGKPVKNVEVRIAEDGEILARGPNVMAGYWKRRKETKETIVDGWLHTGDIGRMDEDGYLYITDRKKDILVNSGGENIAPQRIEGLLATDEMIEQVVVYGDRKPYLVALVVPAREACEDWAKSEGLPDTPWEELATSGILRKRLQTRISKRLKGLAQHEQVRRIMLWPEPLTIEDGLLTPTLKIKRRKVYERFGDELEALYGG